MIPMLVLNVVVISISGIFIWLPTVTALPSIVGYDIDAALVNGMGYVNRVFEALWPLYIMFQGFLFLLLYYVIKRMALRFLLGSRAP